MKKLMWLFYGLILFSLGGAAAFYREEIALFWAQKEIAELSARPVAFPAETVIPSSSAENPLPMPETSRSAGFLAAVGALSPLPSETLLEVPFVCQNPFQDEAGWRYHDESCEEAAVYQAVLYLRGESAPVPQKSHEDFLAMIAWQKQPEHFGTHKDLTGTELEHFVENYFGYAADEVFFFAEADEELIKRILAFGLPVVVPTRARELQNPHYHEQDFHVLTAIGYTEKNVITNDVGTKRGEKFPYSWARFMEANQAGGGGILVIYPRSE